MLRDLRTQVGRTAGTVAILCLALSTSALGQDNCANIGTFTELQCQLITNETTHQHWCRDTVKNCPWWPGGCDFIVGCEIQWCMWDVCSCWNRGTEEDPEWHCQCYSAQGTITTLKNREPEQGTVELWEARKGPFVTAQCANREASVPCGGYELCPVRARYENTNPETGWGYYLIESWLCD